MHNNDQYISIFQRCPKRDEAFTPHAFWLAVALFAASVMLTACKPSDQKSQSNLDTGVMRIDIDGHRFDVPLRYMYSYALATYGRWPTPKKEVAQVDALNLSVLLPDMRPYYKEDDIRWKERGNGDKAEVMIAKFRGPKKNWGMRKMNQEFVAESPHYKREPDVHGLFHYGDANRLPYDNGDRYFYLSQDRKLEISCSPAHPAEGVKGFWSPSCSVVSDYRPYLVLEYSYALKYLPQWKEIDDRMKAMFDKFAQSAQASHSRRSQP